MLTILEIVKRLEDRNLREVARRVGIAYPSLLYFFAHQGGSRVDFQMAEKLSDYLEGEHKKVEEPINEKNQ